MPRLDAATRNIAIGRIQAGESQNVVARDYNVHRSTISRLWQRYQQQGTTDDRPRSGRPRVTTAAQDRYIRLLHLRNRTVAATVTPNRIPGLRRISAQTIRNRLRAHGLRARRPYFGATLRDRHRQARVRWCNTVRVWNLQNWRRVWFSDESRFHLEKRDGRIRVYRRRNERFAQNCVVEVDNFGGGSVMMWAAISYARNTQLVHIPGNLNAVRYRDEILRPHLLPAMNVRREVFQHDNARPHTARITTDFLDQQNVNVMRWPARSPDLNPIEHLWDELDRRVRQREPAPQNLRQLEQALQQEWQTIPQARVRTLIASMPRRVTAVLQANGGHNRY